MKEFLRRLKMRIKQFVTWLRQKAKQLKEWCVENKDAVAAVAIPVIFKAAKECKRRFIKPAGVRWAEKERYRIDHTYYDRRNDIYYTLNRKMSNSEAAIFERRKRDGVPVYKILADLGLLDVPRRHRSAYSYF